MEESRLIEVQANGLTFPCLEQGSGALALCLHGFPDHPYTFQNQLAALSQRGFRAVAPFMRGYAPGCIPADGRYQMAVLAQDAAALVEALGHDRAVIIGHDWGASVGYSTAILFPDRVERLVTIAVPYGPAFRTAMVADPAQQKRSWYMYLLNMPFAEAALTQDDFALVERLWHDWSPGWTPPPGTMEQLKQTFRQPGVALAALTYYRHSFNRDLHDPALAELQGRIGRDPIRLPALYLHGADDGCISPGYVGAMEPYFSAGLQHAVIEGAGHFAHQEKPDEVNRAILAFIGG